MQQRNRAIIYSGETALYLYGLTDREYSSVCVTVPQGYNASHLKDNDFDVSVKYAASDGIKSIAFSSISTEVYSFPVDFAAKITVKTVNRFLEDNENSFDFVEWVLFDSEIYCDYEAEVDKLHTKLN